MSDEINMTWYGGARKNQVKKRQITNKKRKMIRILLIFISQRQKNTKECPNETTEDMINIRQILIWMKSNKPLPCLPFSTASKEKE